MPAGDIVVVHNEGDRPFRSRWNNQQYEIPPGGQVYAPWEAMVRWCGDPGARDTDKERFRTDEVSRLDCLYGLLNAPFYSDEPRRTHGMETTVPPEPQEDYQPHDNRYRHPHLPRLDVRTAAGDKVVTVLDDPFGDSFTPSQIVTQDASLVAAIQKLESEIAAMKAQQALEAPPPPPLDAADTEPEPAPAGRATVDAPPSRRSQPRR